MIDPNRVLIFDTTLRDGAPSPGCSMTEAEKLRVAKALAEQGFDVTEAMTSGQLRKELAGYSGRFPQLAHQRLTRRLP
jgi:isopropylmalate/homocitrate/citramalate synthase